MTGNESSNTFFLTSKAIYDWATGLLSGKEASSNKVTAVSGSSTDVQYPSAKLLYDQLALKAAALGADDNYVTDAEKIVIGNTSGTNS